MTTACGARDRDPRVGGQLDGVAEASYQIGVGLELARGGHRHLHPDARGGDHQRVADIVSVADPCHPATGERPQTLPHGLKLGQGLTRVFDVGERVDHRHLGGRCELLDSGV